MAARRLSTRSAMMMLLALCPARSSALDNGVVRLQPLPNSTALLPREDDRQCVYISCTVCVCRA
jgi:hypothetical protein